jgi:hypothetical protein
MIRLKDKTTAAKADGRSWSADDRGILLLGSHAAVAITRFHVVAHGFGN